ncbi:ABC transporter permease [Paenibacillus popilliae]|uniref:Permease component n=1 Tax=Paenibacillus popilliae ATCC 14706 TaxID=1212764 RepID=M9LFY8_PAEPP|nr:ABC transporter permease subunit [Paenibacillus popilliae]GAC41345.1 permease component [Paenibacillus popilliae ATCC 14706]
MIAAACATVISVILAFGLAYIITRSHIKGKEVWRTLFIVPMLVPSIAHGFGLINLFGDNGFITLACGINIQLYGMKGIVFGSVIYAMPIAFFMFSDILRYVDAGVYDACRTLGIPKAHVFFDITLGVMKKQCLIVSSTIFTMVFTDYGVALAIGGKVSTLPVLLYREVIGLLDFSKGGFIAILLFIPAILTFMLGRKTNQVELDQVNGPGYTATTNKARDILYTILCAVTAFIMLMPVISYTIMGIVEQYPNNMTFTWKHIQAVITGGAGKTIYNSLVISLATALLGTTAAYLIAYVSIRLPNRSMARIIHSLAVFPLVIPGIVLGLGYIQFFSFTPIYGTAFILILVNMVHFFSAPYLLAYNSQIKIPKELEQAASSMGIKQMAYIRDILVPATGVTILEMFSFFFIHSMVTISAVAFLSNTKNMTIALLINQYEAQMLFKEAAVVVLLLLCIHLAFTLLVSQLKKYLF